MASTSPSEGDVIESMEHDGRQTDNPPANVKSGEAQLNTAEISLHRVSGTASNSHDSVTLRISENIKVIPEGQVKQMINMFSNDTSESTTNEKWQNKSPALSYANSLQIPEAETEQEVDTQLSNKSTENNGDNRQTSNLVGDITDMPHEELSYSESQKMDSHLSEMEIEENLKRQHAENDLHTNDDATENLHRSNKSHEDLEGLDTSVPVDECTFKWETKEYINDCELQKSLPHTEHSLSKAIQSHEDEAQSKSTLEILDEECNNTKDIENLENSKIQRNLDSGSATQLDLINEEKPNQTLLDMAKNFDTNTKQSILPMNNNAEDKVNDTDLQHNSISVHGDSKIYCSTDQLTEKERKPDMTPTTAKEDRSDQPTEDERKTDVASLTTDEKKSTSDLKSGLIKNEKMEEQSSSKSILESDASNHMVFLNQKLESSLVCENENAWLWDINKVFYEVSIKLEKSTCSESLQLIKTEIQNHLSHSACKIIEFSEVNVRQLLRDVGSTVKLLVDHITTLSNDTYEARTKTHTTQENFPSLQERLRKTNESTIQDSLNQTKCTVESNDNQQKCKKRSPVNHSQDVTLNEASTEKKSKCKTPDNDNERKCEKPCYGKEEKTPDDANKSKSTAPHDINGSKCTAKPKEKEYMCTATDDKEESTADVNASSAAGSPSNYSGHGDSEIKIHNIFSTLKIPHFFINAPQRGITYEEKNMLLLGMPGSGKTTLIESFTSYVMGLKPPDIYLGSDIRRELKEFLNGDDFAGYTAFFHDQKLSITLIDPPRYSGIQVYEANVKNFLEKTFEQDMEIHATGFVVPAHTARLTPSEKLIMGLVQNLCEKSSKNVIPLVTFADSQSAPPVIYTIEHYNIDSNSSLLFNNSVLCESVTEDEVNGTDILYWRKAFRNWKKIIKTLRLLSPISYSDVKQKTKVDVATQTMEADQKEQIKTADQQSPDSMEMENALAILAYEIMTFAEILDTSQYPGSHLQKSRREVWKQAEAVYELSPFKDKKPLEEWLYEFSFDVCKKFRTHCNLYPAILALDCNKP